jgi:prefoldin subunit 5
MLAIELNMNVFVLGAIVLVSVGLGFMIRRSQIRSLKKKIVELEKEMLSNHADILELQKSKALLQQNLQASKIPVIPLNPSKDESADKSLRR